MYVYKSFSICIYIYKFTFLYIYIYIYIPIWSDIYIYISYLYIYLCNYVYKYKSFSALALVLHLDNPAIRRGGITCSVVSPPTAAASKHLICKYMLAMYEKHTIKIIYIYIHIIINMCRNKPNLVHSPTPSPDWAMRWRCHCQRFWRHERLSACSGMIGAGRIIPQSSSLVNNPGHRKSPTRLRGLYHI